MKIKLLAAIPVCGRSQFRSGTLPERPGRVSVQRGGLKGHLCHFVCRTVTASARVRFSLRPGKLARAAESLQILHQIARFLARAIGRSIEQRRIGRHNRVRHQRARRK
jgi:hypothetical protein